MVKNEMDFNVREKLSVIQTTLKAEKSRWNGFGKYNYRSAEDILEATKKYLDRMGCTITISESILNASDTQGLPLMCTTATLTDCATGQEASATAIVGVDLQQKGMQKPQAFGAASSYGKKYALGNLFLIDDTKDADGTNTHGKSASTSKVQAPKKKPVLQGDALEKAKAAIKAGTFTVAAIQKKYEITPEILKTLS